MVAFLVVVGMVDAQESAAGRCPAGSLGACLFYGVLAAAGVYLVFIVGACVVASLLPLESDGGEQPPGGDPPSP